MGIHKQVHAQKEIKILKILFHYNNVSVWSKETSIQTLLKINAGGHEAGTSSCKLPVEGVRVEIWHF